VKAECQCGQLSVQLPGPTPAVVACHCIACQRRSGSPFGVLAYYVADQLVVTGAATRYERRTDEGNIFESFFCPRCGSTVYARTSKHPGMMAVTIGTLADPASRAPLRSVWEETKHQWIEIAGAAQHFARGPR
jgi:hypothetical protein